jgi:hypothetical protein
MILGKSVGSADMALFFSAADYTLMSAGSGLSFPPFVVRRWIE